MRRTLLSVKEGMFNISTYERYSLNLNATWLQVLLYWTSGQGVSQIYWDEMSREGPGFKIATNSFRNWARHDGLTQVEEIKPNLEYLVTDHFFKGIHRLRFDGGDGVLRQIRLSRNIFQRPVPGVDFNVEHDSLFPPDQRYQPVQGDAKEAVDPELKPVKLE